MSGLSALRRSGRFMVMVSRPLSRFCRTISFALMMVRLRCCYWLSVRFLHQRAARQLQRLERVIAGDRADQLVIVPAALRLQRLLDLEQVHVMHHAAVLADL